MEAIVCISAIIENYNALLPRFLESIDSLDFDKQNIVLEFACCCDLNALNLLKKWIEINRSRYRHFELINKTQLFQHLRHEASRRIAIAKIKDEFLNSSRKFGCSHSFILESNIILEPYTLQVLLDKNKPIIAPLLRTLPETNDYFVNFCRAVTDTGSIKYHPEQFVIAFRIIQGTYKVQSVFGAYLIQTKYSEQLSFTKNFCGWESQTFSNNARTHNIDQYICNEREFGFSIHFKNEISDDEKKGFVLAGTGKEINSQIVHTLFAAFADDLPLQKYVKAFDYSKYIIFPVQNKMLFYLDDINDLIKNHVLKRGMLWEEHIHDQFKKYVNPGQTVLDIGAHIGIHAINLSRLVGEQGKVYAFEPQVKLFVELVINLHLNACHNVICVRKALGAEKKTIGFAVPRDPLADQMPSSFVNEGCGRAAAPETAAETVEMVRLDDLNIPDISLMKIDVEGSELEVISGGSKTIQKNKPLLIVEIQRGPDKEERIRTIEKLGYKAEYLKVTDFVFKPRIARAQSRVKPTS